MKAPYTIGELARAAGVRTSTVRYYERVGLLEPSDRSEGNYRLYAEDALERLRFIKAAQASGFTLEDISKLIDHHHHSAAACREVQTLLEERLGQLKQQMDHLRHVQHVLKATLDRCRREERAGHCHVLDQYSVASKQPSKKSSRARPKES
jgi:DNA-binding transcriptional MerR regulator